VGRTVKLVLSIVVAAGALLILPLAAQATIAYVKYGHYPRAPKVFSAANDGSAEVFVGRGADPAVSPDGNLVAYLNKRGKRERLRAAPSSGGASNLLIEAARITSVAWSPESTRIAAVRAPAHGREKLVLIDLPSGGQNVIARVIARGSFGRVSFSPNGDQLVYSRLREGHSDIYRFAVGGHGSKRLTYDHRSQAPLWGPRNRIAFVKQVGEKRKLEIYTMGSDGGDVRRVTRTKPEGSRSGYYPVAWSPDGSRLLANYTLHGKDVFGVVVYTQAGSLGRLRHRKAHFIGASFSCDGNFVLGSKGRYGPVANHKVGLVPAASGTMQVLAEFAYEPSLGGC
jgi:Tol biopolymer transport system component